MEQKLIVGCNYHTTWQSHSAMRFVLIEIKGDKARLKTRASKKDFWTDVKDLIFIRDNKNTQLNFVDFSNRMNCYK